MFPLIKKENPNKRFSEGCTHILEGVEVNWRHKVKKHSGEVNNK